MMRLALEEARAAACIGEVPIGAVLVAGDQILAKAHNLVEQLHDATAHAEVLAIQRASKALENWRLTDSTLYVTLEPCSMCIGAAVLARIGTVVFAARDERQGAVGSCFDLSRDCGLPHSIQVIEGILAAESRQLLKDFFQSQCRS